MTTITELPQISQMAEQAMALVTAGNHERVVLMQNMMGLSSAAEVDRAVAQTVNAYDATQSVAQGEQKGFAANLANEKSESRGR